MSFDIIPEDTLRVILSFTDDKEVTAQVCHGWYLPSLQFFGREKHARINDLVRNMRMVLFSSDLEPFFTQLKVQDILACQNFKQVKAKTSELTLSIFQRTIALKPPQDARATYLQIPFILLEVGQYRMANVTMDTVWQQHEVEDWARIVSFLSQKNRTMEMTVVAEYVQGEEQLASVQKQVLQELLQRDLFAEAEQFIDEIEEDSLARCQFQVAFQKKWKALAENHVDDAILLICRVKNGMTKRTALIDLAHELNQKGLSEKAAHITALRNELFREEL